MDIRLRRDDLDKLLTLVESGQIRDVSGLSSGASSSQSEVSVAGNDFEPGDSGGNSMLTAFGQYFDRGLEAAGEGADVAAVLGQSQAYGAVEAITNLLRKWIVDSDGSTVKTAYLLGGGLDDSGRAQLPTLDDIRANFRIMSGGQELTSDDIQNFAGTGQPLLRNPAVSFKSSGEVDLDAIGHHLVAGDGRADGPASLMYTIWNRNHNQWVDRLREETGGAWSEEKYFEAARIINVAEYQRVVFTEFADALSQPLGRGDPGFEVFSQHDTADFDAGQSNILSFLPSEKASFVDKVTGETRHVSLADTFLGHGKRFSIDEGPAAGLKYGDAGVGARASAVHPFLELAALAGARDRDKSAASFNQLRAELFVLTGLASLRPYDSWADFQARNNLSDDVVSDLQAAYPEGIDAMDVWVGGLAEAPADGQLGSTLGWLARDEIDRLHEDGFSLDHMSGLQLQAELDAQSFSDIIMRNTGLQDLPEKIFLADEAELSSAIHLGDGDDIFTGTTGDDVIFGHGGNDVIDGGAGNDEIYGGGGDDIVIGGSGDDLLMGEQGNDNLSGGSGEDLLAGGGDDDTLSGGSGADSLAGSSGNDILSGDAGDDTLAGGLDEDVLFGGAGSDNLAGGEGNDFLFGGEFDNSDSDGRAIIGSAANDQISGSVGNDVLAGGSGADAISGGSGNDWLSGGSGVDSIYGGNDADTLDGGSGDDQLRGGRGDDNLFGGSGSDHLDGGSGNDRLDGGSGDDVLQGGSGSNFYDGGSGDDWISSVSGSDTIVLHPGFGNDYVSGFDADSSGAGGQTRIDVSAYGFDSDALGIDILILAHGDDTVIAIGSDTLTLLSVNAQTIDRNDFIFS